MQNAPSARWQAWRPTLLNATEYVSVFMKLTTKQLGASDYGSPLEPRAVFCPGDPGIVSCKEEARLHHSADDGLPPGNEKSTASDQEDRHGANFRGAVSREAAERKLIDDLLGLFGGRSRPIMAHLIESGTLTLDDVREAEKTLLKLAGEEKPQ
jgi:hypothetical protein